MDLFLTTLQNSPSKYKTGFKKRKLQIQIINYFDRILKLSKRYDGMRTGSLMLDHCLKASKKSNLSISESTISFH
jgi:hypothetical protein